MSQQTAMATDPSTTQASGDPLARQRTRLAYLKKTRPRDPQIRKLEAQLQGAGTPGGQPLLDPKTMGKQMYNQFGRQSMQFDPKTFQSQYQPVYGQEMDRARENIMGTFQRRNQEEFKRQSEDVERQIVERGLDPASPAADYLRRANTTRQDLARQEAMSGAEKQAFDVQQQMFEQGVATSLLPGQIWQQYQDPYLTYMQNQQRKWEMKNQPKPSGGGGGGGGQQQANYFDKYMEQEFLNRYQQGGQQQQADPLGQAAQGFLGGFGQGMGQQMGRNIVG